MTQGIIPSISSEAACSRAAVAQRTPACSVLPSVVFRYPGAFSDSVEGVNEDLVSFGQQKLEQSEATLDQDGSLVEAYKREALFGYQGCKAYPPLTTYWLEQDRVIHSEFRDG